jgi:2-isopropylmalate synthase
LTPTSKIKVFDMNDRPKNHVVIFDSTLRDAEQSPGASLNVGEKVEIAHQLAQLNVDIIEAGFPVSSPVQFEAVQRISREVEGPVICGLARTVKKDIDSAAEALSSAKHWRIHTFSSTSPTHMEHMLRMTPAKVLEKAVEAVRHAKGCTADVEFSGQDAPRSDINFLYEILAAVIEAGATTLNIPDTVGYSTPEEYGELIAKLVANVAGIENCTVSTHCHNDLGLATANSLAGVVNGARQIECTINGLGERAGNASLEEVVMAMKTRQDLYHVDTQIHTKEIYRTSQMVERLMGLSVQVNKAIVGANAFAHESGIHVDGMLKHRETYEILTPESVGVPGSRMVLGRHSGRHGFKARVEELGFELSEQQVDDAYAEFLVLADKKKEIYDADLMALLRNESLSVEESYRLDHLQCTAGIGMVPSATVRILHDGESVQEAAWGDGPVDATYRAINKATGLTPNLENYTIRAVTESSEALAEAVVRIKEDGKIFAGRGISTDIVEASAKAYVNAINHMLARGSGLKS